MSRNAVMLAMRPPENSRTWGPGLIAGSVRTGPVLAEGGGAKPPSPPRRPGRPTNLPASLELTSVAALHAYLTGRLGALKGIRHVETAPTGRRIKRAAPLLARRRSAGHAQAHRPLGAPKYPAAERDHRRLPRERGPTPDVHTTDPHESRTKMKALIADQGLCHGEGDENRTRALSLGIAGNIRPARDLTSSYVRVGLRGTRFRQPSLTAVRRTNWCASDATGRRLRATVPGLRVTVP